MSVRVRFLYEKRGGACFVPHVALISIFTRAALRAGLSLAMTEGFSPHPKMSFGPELPAGVVALAEPVDLWLEDAWIENAPFGQGELLSRWNGAMPEGFRLLRASLLPAGAPSLGRVCRAALYWVRGAGTLRDEALLARALEHYGGAVLDSACGRDIEGDGRADWLSLVLDSPAQNGIGGWVRRMIADGDIAGWHELNIVRAAIGTWEKDARRVGPPGGDIP